MSRRIVPLLALFALSAPAYARTYPVAIYAETEDELRLLVEDGLLDEGDFDTLRELLNNPININEASRNALYDLPGITLTMARDIVVARRERPFSSLDDLERAGVPPEVIEQLTAFAYSALEADKLDRVSGRVRLRTVANFEPVEPIEDDNPGRTHTIEQLGFGKIPASYLTVRARYDKTWEVGALGLVQEELARVVYSPETRDLYGTWGTPAFQPGKAFLSYDGKQVEVIAGSYGAGFGLGLTFDATNRTHPDGWYTDLAINGVDRYSLDRQLLGSAVTWKSPEFAGNMWVETTAFVSSQRHDIYQYDVAITAGEDIDPYTADDLASPVVLIGGQKVGYVTLPNAYRESLGGLNVTLKGGDRKSVGLTTYAGHLDTTTIEGVTDPNTLTLRNGYPVPPTYGAVGLNGAFGLGPVDLLGEAATTFSGGSGLLVKAIWTPEQGEVEASLRRYGSGFDNPHARGLAAPDEYHGMRDRDEVGARVKAQLDPMPWLHIRTTGDLWDTPSINAAPNIDLLGQLTFTTPRDEAAFAVYGRTVNRDIVENDRSYKYGGTLDEELIDEGDPSSIDAGDGEISGDRKGSRHQLGAQVSTKVVPHMKLSAFYRRSYEDNALLYPISDTACDYWYQIGHYTWFRAQYDPTDSTRLTARVRYLDEDVYGAAGDHLVETYLQVDQKLPYRVKLSARGTVGWDLPDTPAAWDRSCDLAMAGTPELEGTCVTDPDSSEVLQERQAYGFLWFSAEVRF